MDTTQETNVAAFNPFPKMGRLSRPVIITEKIDGTNAQVLIVPAAELSGPVRALAYKDDLVMFAGSRTRYIEPDDDNYGFARWARDNQDELFTLGAGRHFGEWWGKGINRNYGVDFRKFSLFNVIRWAQHGAEPKAISQPNPKAPVRYQDRLPACCDLVPVLAEHPTLDTGAIETLLNQFTRIGSLAAPGFMRPEGIVVFHPASGVGFKKTIEGDESPKSLQA